MIVWCILLSIVFNYIRIKTKSVVGAAFIHGTTNAVAGLALLYITGGNDIIIGLTGIAGFISILTAIIILFVIDKYVLKENVFTSKISAKLDRVTEPFIES